MDSLYVKLLSGCRKGVQALTPYFRRVVRFLALPYCYFGLVDWKRCEASRWQVAKDFVYFFFVLKMFPDYYFKCRLWTLDKSEWKYLYGSVYDAYQRAKVRKVVQPAEYQVLFRDKYVCHQLCTAAGLPVPRFLGRAEDPESMERILTGFFQEEEAKKAIMKPVRGQGGSGIGVAFLRDGDIQVNMGGVERPLAEFAVGDGLVIEEYLTQHEALSAFSPSMNTLRILTLFTKSGESMLLFAILRFGIGDTLIDNLSQGGVGLGVDVDTGTLFDKAYDLRNRVYLEHPDSRIPFEGFTVPGWPEIVALSKRSQDAFSYYRLLGLDIAMTDHGPVIIEINEAPDTAALELFRPLLRDERVLREFLEYDLLPNRLLG